MIYIVSYGILIDYDLLGAAGQPIEEGKRFTDTQQHTKEDAVENEMVNLPPLMEPEEGKREEIEQAASESRHLADELAGMLDQLEIEEERSAAVNAVVLGEQEEVEGDDDDEREGARNAEEIVENPFFNGLDEEGSKGLLIKREAEDQEAKEEAEELKEREEEERTRKGHEADQRVEEEAERQARETEVSCVGIQQNRPSVIVAARSRKRAIEDETNNKDAAVELSDADVNAVVLGEQEVVGQASLDEARIAWIFGYLDDGYLDIWKMKQDKEKETTAHGHVATLSTEERVRGIKKEITLDED